MYLNEMTAKATGKTVFAGPIEATALGNILAQMMGKGVVGTMDEARKIIEDSFEVKTIKA
jgi:rhamnulokinase